VVEKYVFHKIWYRAFIVEKHRKKLDISMFVRYNNKARLKKHALCALGKGHFGEVLKWLKRRPC